MKLERVQKNACRNILKEKYESYENSLRVLSIDTLFERRKKLLLAFGRKCLKLDQTKDLFPLNENIDTLKLRTRGVNTELQKLILKVLGILQYHAYR